MRLEAPAREIVRACGNENTARDFKRNEKSFAVRVPVEFEAVAGFETKIHRSHEIFPRFDDAEWVGVADVFIFKKFLTNPFERAVF